MAPNHSDFKTLIERVRQGDAEAARILVDSYESELRIVVRSRLRDSRLRRTFDSMDLCQSVLGNFFVRAAGGQFDVESPEDLMKLLAKMVRNKATDYHRRERAEKRDAARIAQEPADELPIAANDSTPSQMLMARELLNEVRSRLPDDILRISNLRKQGEGWDEIGEQLEANPDAVRKRFTRYMNRVCEEVGLVSLD